MAYLHKINNLYKDQSILMFNETFCLEKLHGTNIKLTYSIEEGLRFFSGGARYENFIKLFNQEEILEKLKLIGHNITLYGECIGGKEQGMSHTYGDKMSCVFFDVKIGDSWLSVPQAEDFCKSLNLEFVHYVKTSTNLADLDAQRDADSVQAVRNGCGSGKLREGIVCRGLVELTKNNGERVICKHKREEFRETKTPRPIIDPHKLEVLKNAEMISNEWITKTRLEHILQKIPVPDPSIELMSEVISSMVEDIKIEGAGEIIWNKDVEKVICRQTALLFKNYLKGKLYE